jgi:nuclear transport factor 2 (NTF2) superfamily protein
MVRIMTGPRTPASAPADGPQPAARPLADVMRELADRYDADVPGYPRGVVMVQAETVREWANEIERLMKEREEIAAVLKRTYDHNLLYELLKDAETALRMGADFGTPADYKDAASDVFRIASMLNAD